MKKRIMCIILLTVTAVWIGFIWSNSLKNASQSTVDSNKACNIITEVSDKLGIEQEISEKVVRKSAHFTEFMVLGVLFCADAAAFGLFGLNKRARNFLYFLLPPAAAFLIACSDEFIQKFSEGRCCQFSDVMIDFGGASLGTLLCFIVFFIVYLIHCRNQNFVHKNKG